MKKRTDYITLLSVFSCIAVVFLHTNDCFWTFSTERYWKTANIIECLAYFAVPCFFMISGATLLDYRERYSLKEYFSKRIKKTVIPFIAWSLIGLLSRIVVKAVSISDIDIKYLYNGIMGASIVSIYWFFPTLFCIYLSIPLFAAVEKSARKEIFTYLAVVGFALNFVIPLIKNVRFPGMVWSLSIGAISGNYIYIIIGYLLKEFDLSKKQRRLLYLSSAAGFLIHLIGTYVVSMEAGTVLRTFKGYPSAPCIMYSVGIFTWFKYNGPKLMNHAIVNKFVTFISKYTFGIYLVHIYFKEIILRGTDIDARSMLFRLGAPFVIIPASIATLWVLKKIPFMKYIVP